MDIRKPEEGVLLLAGAILTAISLGLIYMTGEVLILYALLGVGLCLFLCLRL